MINSNRTIKEFNRLKN